MTKYGVSREKHIKQKYDDLYLTEAYNFKVFELMLKQIWQQSDLYQYDNEISMSYNLQPSTPLHSYPVSSCEGVIGRFT
jgi:hypothetical protein